MGKDGPIPEALLLGTIFGAPARYATPLCEERKFNPLALGGADE